MSKIDYLRVAAACPQLRPANVTYNVSAIQACIEEGRDEQAKVIIFPELSLTGYTCGDLFLQQQLLEAAVSGLEALCRYSAGKDMLIAVGAPLRVCSSLYNCACLIFEGHLLGIVPKQYIPNYEEYYERRWFTSGLGIKNQTVDLRFQHDIPFGSDLLFKHNDFTFAVEICEDLWTVIPPSGEQCLAGATVIGNLSASNEIVSKSAYRRGLVEHQSARCIGAYIYAGAGVGESTTDVVFGGELLIAENGIILADGARFRRQNTVKTALIDLNRLNNQRLKNISFRDAAAACTNPWRRITFAYKDEGFGRFDRFVDRYPFVPADQSERAERCAEIFSIQTAALAKRFEHTRLDRAVIGVSGGLDSTLALLVVAKTFDLLKRPRRDIVAVTLPGFGTTDRTYANAVSLCRQVGAEFREVNIVAACLQHFKDIGHDPAVHDITYENVQARERTQLLMDIANKEGGLVIGTGDLSELALGWSTYNGDHMSMYAVNCSVPKTLVRYLVRYVAEDGNVGAETSHILLDILDTPVSPELLPKDSEGKIAQKTEDIVGPYMLHDFFLYYFVRCGYTPNHILFLAEQAFASDFDRPVIVKWLKVFLKRFFSQQFKRSAIPDGPKVGTVSLSPRGDWRMPSDGSVSDWLNGLV
ncbi:MAG: NAD(+) synthase [Sporolactobacillus sp.]